VTTDNSSIADISPDSSDNVTVTGVTRVQASKGVYYYSEVKFSAEPGTEIRVKVASDALASVEADASGYSSLENLNVGMQVRECLAGESLVGKECVRCDSGTYSLDPAISWAACPTGAQCLGGNLILPKAGYWRPSKYTDTIFECPNPAACIGQPHIMPSLTGDCALGYRGNKCQA